VLIKAFDIRVKNPKRHRLGANKEVLMEQNSNHFSEDEISLKELILTLLKHKKLIAAMTIIVVILTFVGSLWLSGNSQEAKLIVALKFESIAENRNPDGTTFDPYQMATPYILSDVISELKLEGRLTANQVRSLVNFEPLIPDEIRKKAKFALEKEGTSIVFYPNEFVLSVKSNKGYGVDGALAAKLANQIVESYINYFGENYADTLPITNQLSAFDASSYDYSDVSQVLHQQMTEMIKYLSVLAVADNNFRSKHTGFTFSEILQTVSIVDEVDLNRMDSLISSYKLTKDPARLMIYYTYMINQLQLERDKKAAETTTSRNTLSNIENSSNKLLETLTGNLSDKQDKESYFNALILKTADIGTSSADLTQDINYYQAELNDLQTQKYNAGPGRVAAEANVKLLMPQITESMTQWIEVANETAKEFYDKKMSNAILPLSPAEISSKIKLSLNLAIGTILGLMLGMFVAFFIDYWKRAE
jgi:succinoglycan biosynthesis transport protein ExoP